MKMKLYKSDWLGICVGIIIGAFQPFVIIGNQHFLSFNDEVFDKVLLQVIAFGLIVPPLLAIITKYLIKSPLAFYEKIGKYINIMFIIIVFGITAGSVGLIYHAIAGLSEPKLIRIAFFGSAGLGFLGAYFINPELADRPRE